MVVQFPEYPQVTYSVMHANFSGWGPPNVWGSVYNGQCKFLLLGEAMKFRGIFQKFDLKLLEIYMKNNGEIFRKMQNFHENFLFIAHGLGKNENYYLDRL